MAGMTYFCGTRSMSAGEILSASMREPRARVPTSSSASSSIVVYRVSEGRRFDDTRSFFFFFENEYTQYTHSQSATEKPTGPATSDVRRIPRM